jgi:multiple sugar transport system substrate-binding protein
MNKKLTSRIAGGLALASAAALALAGCSSSSGGSSAGSSGGTTTLKLVVADYGTGPSNTSSKYWATIVSAFEAAHSNIKVNVTTIPWTNFDSQVQTMVQNKNYPDITEGDYFSNYAQDGLLYSASDVLSDPSNLLPAFQAQGTYNGVQYGMPFTTSSRTLFYNKKLFTQAGITAAPQTWADVEADAAKITKLGDVGFGLPLGNEEAEAESLLWMLGDGGGYQTAGKYTIDSPANVTAFTFLKGMVAAGDTEPNPGTVDRTPLWEQFAQGKVGMINGSPALIPIIQSANVLTPAQRHPRRLRQRRRVQGQRPRGADQGVPRLRLPGQVPARVRQRVRPAPGDGHRRQGPVEQRGLRPVPHRAAELGTVPERHRVGEREDQDSADDRHRRDRQPVDGSDPAGADRHLLGELTA